MRAHRRFRPIGYAIVIAMALSGLTMAGFAEDQSNEHDPDGEPVVQGPDEAREHDARMYAEAFDVDVETAKRNLELQELAGDLRMALEEAESDTYGGQFAEHGFDYRIVVLLTDGNSDRVRPFVEGTPLEEFVEVRQVNYSWAELREQHQTLIALMQRLAVDYNSETNIWENRIDLLVVDRPELEEAVLQAELELPENVTILEVDSLATDEVEKSSLVRSTFGRSALASHGGYTIGGRTLNPVCTVGFPVRSSHGTAGFLSAGHCRYGQQTFWTVNGVETPLMNEWWTGPYDVQWHATPHHAVYNQVMVSYSPYQVRTISAVKSWSAMNLTDWVCVFGKNMTHQRCGQIINLEHNPSTNNCACFVRVSDPGGGDLTAGGDSGAPYYKDNQAWGVHKSGLGNDAIFMPVDRIGNFGLSVLTWCPSGGCW